MMKVALLFFVAVTASYALTRAVGHLPADCEPIAEQLTSWELGNYAAPEERAPVIEKYTARCSDAWIGIDEAECLKKAKTRHAAAKCAPRLFPEIEVSDCDGAACVVEKLRDVTERVCACQTQACSQRVLEDYTRWAADFAKQHAGADAPDMSATTRQQVTALTTRMSACMQRVQPSPR